MISLVRTACAPQAVQPVCFCYSTQQCALCNPLQRDLFAACAVPVAQQGKCARSVVNLRFEWRIKTSAHRHGQVGRCFQGLTQV